MERLIGKAAIVVGATADGNMGQAIAKRFVAEGARVVVAGRRELQLEQFAEEIGATPIVCDLTKKADVFSLARRAAETMGHIDVAVNSTGIALGGPFVEFPEDLLDRLIALQFKGSFFFFQAMVAIMKAPASIIQLSSFIAQPSGTVEEFEGYAATKAAIDQVVRAVANSVGGRGIRVNTIAAGHTRTPMTRDITSPWDETAMIENYPLGRFGHCQDVAAAAVWLASDECFTTGDTLQINGGLQLRRNPLTRDFERHKKEYLAAHGSSKS